MPWILTVYLAGPDVFYPEAKEKLGTKKAILNKHGIHSHTPLDKEISFAGKSKQDIANEIAHSNEKIMEDCNIILANLENWHGSPSADVGTAFEMGYMSARFERDPKKVMIVGYYPNGIQKKFSTRVVDKLCDGKQITQDGILIDPSGYEIEDFDLLDNLMLVQAISKSGGKIYGSFEEAAQNLTQLWQQKQAEIQQIYFTPSFNSMNHRFFAGLACCAIGAVAVSYMIAKPSYRNSL